MHQTLLFIGAKWITTSFFFLSFFFNFAF
ncbi:unnamed protein product [Spirodela intermedia]|uniref:Uncharacterized protein n=1 Tax=Spirodela intermedia TaxID=51605 RepID=A0A7I8JNY1_SPIIN|nr:unnamed protein product [Spirodela intermedia]CAA6671859.1 unnamed protein product [Spirodela intermedia]